MPALLLNIIPNEFEESAPGGSVIFVFGDRKDEVAPVKKNYMILEDYRRAGVSVSIADMLELRGRQVIPSDDVWVTLKSGWILDFLCGGKNGF